MSWSLVAIVLLGAALHASWNALIKSGGDKAADTALLQAIAGLMAVPPLLVLGLPERAAWPFIGVSALVHVAYYTTLVGAYRHGDLGLTYPIMRGSAPLLVAIGSGTLIGERPSTLTWFGVAGISVGVALIGLARQHGVLHHRKALAFAFANAAIIAIYTVVDGRGVRLAGQPLSYVLTLFVVNGCTYPLVVYLRRDAAGRAGLRHQLAQRWPASAGGAAASIGSYAIALWAMTRAPVASVAALRETSVLFAAVLGTWLLRERFGAQRALGTGVVVAGVIALRFG
ncbi:EamA family transporter [Piscinibacter koreensis]|uniref:EamA family transporter n=1 Tax=Piscinibacter koreensis TaxID=2742824 RepID=UPI001FE5D89B|nr:EamA family transporter [Schlegelella koreensis]